MKADAGLAELRPSSTFSGTRVQIDEQRWSAALSAQLSAWARVTPTLVVLPGGRAVVSHVRSPVSFGDYVGDQWDRVDRHLGWGDRTRAFDTCAVLRFAPGTVASLPRRTPDHLSKATSRSPNLGASLVQVGPGALFRYYWRRRALSLEYPSPETHVEDDAVALFRHVLFQALPCGLSSRPADFPNDTRHRALAVQAQAIIWRAIASPHPIAEIARKLAVSPFHLAHVFRAEVGASVHQYLLQVRLITALDRLRDGAPDLSKLSLELGFSHHSHFTSLFRRAIGYAPRDVRRMLTATNIAGLGVADQSCCRDGG